MCMFFGLVIISHVYVLCDLMRVYFQNNKEMCYVNVDSSLSVNIDDLHDNPK